jgi:CheY-like chemotaxis protein
MGMGRGNRDGLVLLVEDDPIISLDTSMSLQELGAGKVEAAFTLEEASAALDRASPTLVVMDIDLRGVITFPLAERLAAMGIPFVFTTGHGAELPIPPALQGAPVIGKPYDPEQLRLVLAPYLSGPAP